MRTCTGCGKEKDTSSFYAKGPSRWDDKCKECRKTGRKEEYQIRRPEKLAAYHRNREAILPKIRKQRASLRLEVLAHYSGGKPHCACCKDRHSEFLVIDHINEDGAEHRRAISNCGAPGASIYRWLKRAGYPEGFQVLCQNCNYAKHLHGTCPHHQESL